MRKLLIAGVFLFTALGSIAQINSNTLFEQLGTQLPSPNTYRTGSGAPGTDYWQQKADYTIKVDLDDKKQTLTASETIVYHNNAPEALSYLWLQLDQNVYEENATGSITSHNSIENNMSQSALSKLELIDNGYGHKITAVKDVSGTSLPYTINQTMMRVNLPKPLNTGETFTFSVDWNFNIVNLNKTGGRGGYEYFEKDGNYLYEIAQWFPRMCVYDDVNGWQNKQFIGSGEFALTFGDYHVEITAPNDLVVGATGTLENPGDVLTKTQINRLKEAENTKTPVLIITPDEAKKNEKSNPSGKKTWVFKANNVRDFAFAASRKFIWDAMAVDIEGKKVWAMSLYPNEGNPLWGQYSTRVIAHTIERYSARTIPYPYPVAWSVHGPVRGMEYPMMSFNGGRPEEDGTYPERTKNFLILVIVHEVGHNFFPMIINSDERQWSWMDEGLNSFMEGITCLEWDRDFPVNGILPSGITRYMRTEPSKQNPIMSSSDNIVPGTFGPNAYSKPATGLNILRETIMGRELFDYAFKEYAKRWAFKHPKPADFFRTMEDASGVDLDWFWKGWFYGVDATNQAITNVNWYQADSQNPETNLAAKKAEYSKNNQNITNIRNKTDIKETVVERDPTMRDFYNSYDPFTATPNDKQAYNSYVNSLSTEEKTALNSNKNYYEIEIENKGGLVMPVIIKMNFEDGTSEDLRYPAEIWRYNNKSIKKTVATTKKVSSFVLDPYFEVADIDTSDNHFPKQAEQPSKFELIKARKSSSTPNPMQAQSQAGVRGSN